MDLTNEDFNIMVNRVAQRISDRLGYSQILSISQQLFYPINNGDSMHVSTVYHFIAKSVFVKLQLMRIFRWMVHLSNLQGEISIPHALIDAK